MNPLPTSLRMNAEGLLLIEWNDGQHRAYKPRELRDQCPCATCQEQRTGKQDQPAELLPVISPDETRPLRTVGMNPVGDYAYNIDFSDGHNTGIYTLESLHEQGSPLES